MPLNESNVVPRARRLLVYTIDAANFSDKMDIIFVAEMIEKFGKFVEKFKDVSGSSCSIASRNPYDELIVVDSVGRNVGCHRGVFSQQSMTIKINAQQLFAVTLFNETGTSVVTFSPAGGSRKKKRKVFLN